MTRKPRRKRHSAAIAVARFRRRLHEILELAPRDDRLSVVVNRTLIALIALNLLDIVLELVPSLEGVYGTEFLIIEYVSLVAFTVEYALRVWVAPDHPLASGRRPWRVRLVYVLSGAGLIDLLAVVPFWVGLFFSTDLRVLLVFRIVRFLKLARYSPAMRSLLNALYSERRALFGCGVIALGATLVWGTVMHLVEGAVQPEKFGTIPDAMWWAIATLTTTGYGDVIPVTPLGKFLAGLAMPTGIILIALPVGIIATAFADEIRRRDFVVTWGMVARVPLFAGLDAGEIAEVIRLLSAQTVEAGATIVRRGEAGQSMYFIASGEVEIELPERRVRLAAGQFFGEIAVLRRTRRSATVTAVIRTSLLILDGNDLHDLIARNPRLAERVRGVADKRLKENVVGSHGDMLEQELGPDDSDSPDITGAA